jgi:hypothetical protein
LVRVKTSDSLKKRPRLFLMKSLQSSTGCYSPLTWSLAPRYLPAQAGPAVSECSQKERHRDTRCKRPTSPTSSPIPPPPQEKNVSLLVTGYVIGSQTFQQAKGLSHCAKHSLCLCGEGVRGDWCSNAGRKKEKIM